MNIKYILPFLLILSLNACSVGTPDPLPEPTVTMQVQYTDIPTFTPIPSRLIPTPTTTAMPTQTATLSAYSSDINFTFISETIPDGTRFDPGEVFRKTWTIKNSSTQSWEGFSLAIESSSPDGELLGSPTIISLPVSVSSGQTVNIAVDLITPLQDGYYSVYYHLQDQIGTPVENTRIWVNIIVGNANPFTSQSIYATYQSSNMEFGVFKVYFCMHMPDERQWYPWNVSLIITDKHYQPEGSRIDPIGATTDFKCFTFSYPNEVSPNTDFQLSIDRIELPPEVHLEENCLRAQSSLKVTYPELSFSCSGPGSFYTNLVLPPGMTTAEAERLILDAMSSTIYGPWIVEGKSP
ncbi:MAG: hypothetical protein IH585_05945 [Anaerolineaceae bacterium]|nr:hypothetical protein [Anaerolineaceae bacterium]